MANVPWKSGWTQCLRSWSWNSNLLNKEIILHIHERFRGSSEVPIQANITFLYKFTSHPMKKRIKKDITLYVRTGKTEKNPNPQMMVVSWNQVGLPSSPWFYIDESTVLDLTWFEQKRLYLYLFRNKNIQKFAHGTEKLIDLREMLRYLWDTIHSLENQKRKR